MGFYNKFTISIMNDSALAVAITKHLIKATELLYLNPSILLTEADVVDEEIESEIAKN
jgi:hypothetical protein